MTKCKYEYMITCFIDTVIYTQNIYLVDSLSYYKRYVFINVWTLKVLFVFATTNNLTWYNLS